MIREFASDYAEPLTNASRSALLELTRVLDPYLDGITLIGGWVPYLLLQEHRLPDSTFVHIGSADVDLLLDPRTIEEPEYETIAELLTRSHWRQMEGEDHRFSWLRPVPVKDGESIDIKVDFHGPEPAGPGRIPRHLRVQPKLEVRTLNTAEIAFAHRGPITIGGILPDGAETSAVIDALDVVGSLGTKGFALNRRNPKDPYDIVSILDNYGSGVAEVAEIVRPYTDEPLMRQSFSIMRERFETLRSEGPVAYANFMNPGDQGGRDALLQRSHQLVTEFLRRLD